ncbi:hypothetical protein J2Z60_001928 [Lactobacillus colini]|uniref:ABC transporter ATP-binding protein n=1 Tax=Lactobacillus colini TaxID=1819254 RepID=A0ABS4MGB5_9LACO|nr:hypothetical protein [Lactobacillus colini]
MKKKKSTKEKSAVHDSKKENLEITVDGVFIKFK